MTKLPSSPRFWYRSILTQLLYFFDQHAATRIHGLVVSSFRKVRPSNARDERQERKNALSCLRTLRKANLGDPAALNRVIETAYGQRGRLKHRYLAPFLHKEDETSDDGSPSPAELLPGNRRTRPPIVTPQLRALFKLQIKGESRIEPILPIPKVDKPLDPRREANFRWAHYVDLVRKTMPPLPQGDFLALQRMASGRFTESLSSLVDDDVPRGDAKVERKHGIPSWRAGLSMEMQEQARARTCDPHQLTPRYVSRLYQRILSKSPILTQQTNGAWHAMYCSRKDLTRSERKQELRSPEQTLYFFGEVVKKEEQ